MPKTSKNPKTAIKMELNKKNWQTWSELLNSTELSRNALHVHLKDLMKEKTVKKEIDKNDPTKTLYRIIELSAYFDKTNEILQKINKAKTLPEQIEYAKNIDKNTLNLQIYQKFRNMAINMGSFTTKMNELEKVTVGCSEKNKEKEIDEKKDIKEIFGYFSGFIFNSMIFELLNIVFTAACSKNGKKIMMDSMEKNNSSEDIKCCIDELWKDYSKFFDFKSLAEIFFYYVFTNSNVVLQEEPMCMINRLRYMYLEELLKMHMEFENKKGKHRKNINPK